MKGLLNQRKKLTRRIAAFMSAALVTSSFNVPALAANKSVDPASDTDSNRPVSGGAGDGVVNRRAIVLVGPYGENGFVSEGNKTAMTRMFENASFGGKKIETTVITDATASKLRSGIKSVFGAADEDDVSYLYICCHGNNDASLWIGGQYNASEAVTMAQLRTMLDNVSGMKVLLIDSCYSGAAVSGDIVPGSADSTGKDSSVVEKDSSAADKDSSTADKDDSATGKDSSIVEKDSSATDKDGSTADKDDSATGKDSSTVDKDSSDTGRDSSTVDKGDSAAGRDSSTVDKDDSATDKDSTITEKDSSAKDEDASAADKDNPDKEGADGDKDAGKDSSATDKDSSVQIETNDSDERTNGSEQDQSVAEMLVDAFLGFDDEELPTIEDVERTVKSDGADEDKDEKSDKDASENAKDEKESSNQDEKKDKSEEQPEDSTKDKKLVSGSSKNLAASDYRIICSSQATQLSWAWANKYSWATRGYTLSGGYDLKNNKVCDMMADVNYDGDVTLDEMANYTQRTINEEAVGSGKGQDIVVWPKQDSTVIVSRHATYDVHASDFYIESSKFYSSNKDLLIASAGAYAAADGAYAPNARLNATIGKVNYDGTYKVTFTATFEDGSKKDVVVTAHVVDQIESMPVGANTASKPYNTYVLPPCGVRPGGYTSPVRLVDQNGNTLPDSAYTITAYADVSSGTKSLSVNSDKSIDIPDSLNSLGFDGVIITASINSAYTSKYKDPERRTFALSKDGSPQYFRYGVAIAGPKSFDLDASEVKSISKLGVQEANKQLVLASGVAGMYRASDKRLGTSSANVSVSVDTSSSGYTSLMKDAASGKLASSYDLRFIAKYGSVEKSITVKLMIRQNVKVILQSDGVIRLLRRGISTTKLDYSVNVGGTNLTGPYGRVENVKYNVERIARFERLPDYDVVTITNGVIKAKASGIVDVRIEYEGVESDNKVTIIVPGDVDRDARISITDAALAAYCMRDDDAINHMGEYAQELLDMDGNSTIDARDVAIIVGILRNS